MVKYDKYTTLQRVKQALRFFDRNNQDAAKKVSNHSIANRLGYGEMEVQIRTPMNIMSPLLCQCRILVNVKRRFHETLISTLAQQCIRDYVHSKEGSQLHI
jgi:hypothetical protein